ncbi:MAG: radical SAM protein [Candidatus Cloacimonadota bacterium]|nr:MAG: radical SAM protein [Candidatus Cloacimonadota bacterium]
MIGIIPKILLYKSFRKLGFPRMKPLNYTVSLCYRCNSRCKTCNIYKKKAEELSVKEYKKIFKSLGHSPYWITFSGGEPFLRTDIVEIVKAAYKICKPAIINIPSNGILTDKITEDVKNIALTTRKSKLIINLSFDGIKGQHDHIRNVAGNYEKTLKTYNKLKHLKLPNLEVGIHTVISKFNVTDFSAISSKLMSFKPDSYITEIAEERIELDTVGKQISPGLLEYRSAIDFLSHRIKNGKFSGISKITQAFRLEYYNLVKKILRDKTQVIPCYAGFTSVQISPDGDVWACCIKANPVGNLRETNYNFSEIWNSDKMKIIRRSIKNKECWCPLANAAYTNMLMDIPTDIRVFYRSFIKWWT